MVVTKASGEVESRASAPVRISWDPHGLPHTTNARSPMRSPHSQHHPLSAARTRKPVMASEPRVHSGARPAAALPNSETPADAVDGGAMTMRGRSGGQPAWIRACLCWCRHPRSSPLPDRASGPTRPPAARCLSTFGSSMCRGRKPGEFRPYRSVEGRYVSYINRLSRGMRWFKPEKAPDRSVRSARVLYRRCSLRAADGARGEAWRPLTVSHGVSETGTIEDHHRVIHPGRGGS